MHYLLGWIVGDAGKGFLLNRPLARLQLDLCRKHPENLQLGNFVMNCVLMLGIPCKRIADGPPRKREPHGLYRWQSYYSEAISWLFTACIGLHRQELTSYDPVRMDWLLAAPAEHRRWFLRGIADSDGSVNLRNRTTQITSAPNTRFFSALFSSLDVKALTYPSKGVGTISVSAKDAMNMQIFNPEVETHRNSLLQKLANARTFRSRWPGWLETKVSQLLREGLDASSIRDKLLFEDHTYVKLKTIKARMH